MFIDGFTDIQDIKDRWVFFAFSANYRENVSTIFMKVFNENPQNTQQKIIPLQLSQFALNKYSAIEFASVANNPYFDSVSGFVGKLGFVEMTTYYTDFLNNVWMGFMPSIAEGYQGVLIETDFQIYSSESNILQTQGTLNKQIEFSGKYQPLYEIDRNKLGVRFFNNGFIDLGDIEFRAYAEGITGLVFFFRMSYKEQLNDNQIIVQRGRNQENGFLQISLKKVEGGRVIRIQIFGDLIRQVNEAEYHAPSVFVEDEQFYFVAGIVVTPGG